MSVKQNKRVQVRAPSKMNGDNLLQLKNMKQAEASPSVMSFNMASRAEMSRRINWGYKEQVLNLEKVKKGQSLYYKQLQRLAQEKRALQQQSYRYKLEEARLDVEHEKRDKRIRKVLDDYEEKSREIIEDILRATQKKLKRRSVEADLGQVEEEQGEHKGDEEKRRLEEEENERRERLRKEEKQPSPSDSMDEELKSNRSSSGNVRLRHVWKLADAEKHSERRGSVYIEYVYVRPGAKTLTIEAVENKNMQKRRKSRIPGHHSDSDGSDTNQSRNKRRTSLRRSSKTVEVNQKTPDEPKTVFRERSPDIRRMSEGVVLPALTVCNKQTEPASDSGKFEEHKIAEEAIAVVDAANKDETKFIDSFPKVDLPQLATSRPSRQFKALPAINENQALVNQALGEEEEETFSLREAMLRDAQILIVTPLLEEEEEEEEEGSDTSRSRSRSTAECSSGQKDQEMKPMSNIEFLKQKQQELEDNKRKILDQPYTAYSMDHDGNVIPLLNPPKPMKTNPPSNYEKYRRQKLLQRTRAKQKVEHSNLQRFMDQVSQDLDAMPPPPNPNPDISVEEMAHMIEGNTKTNLTVDNSRRTSSLPGSLLLFLQNKYDQLPDDMDPDSVEALARCKYLRDFDAEAAKEARKAGRRQSSWQDNPQTINNTPRT